MIWQSGEDLSTKPKSIEVYPSPCQMTQKKSSPQNTVFEKSKDNAHGKNKTIMFKFTVNVTS